MNTAAFFRVEGILLKKGAVQTATWLAANGQGMRERVFRLGQIALAAPIVGALRQNDRTLTSRMTWAALRGMSEDRLHVLGDEFWEETLEPSLLESGIELISRARKDGHRIVLLSENIAPVVGAMAERIRGVDDFICNSIEISGGETTGRLLPPIVGGHEGGRWLKEFAAEHDIDLSRSVAYAAGGPDLLLLAAVGEPCAVNADYTLRRAATEARWALMDYAA